MLDASGIRSELEIGMKMGNSLEDRGGIVGEVTLECFDADGNLRWTEVKKNLITTQGDTYYAQRGAAVVNSNSVVQPTLVAGMALGTTLTTPAKTSTGSTIVGYLNNSRKNLDATFPTHATNVITYKVTWDPGEATSSDLEEIALTTNTTNVGGTSGTTISYASISPARNKQAGDTLVATWTHTFLGA